MCNTKYIQKTQTNEVKCYLILLLPLLSFYRNSKVKVPIMDRVKLKCIPEHQIHCLVIHEFWNAI